jgi:hypothetical protein
MHPAKQAHLAELIAQLARDAQPIGPSPQEPESFFVHEGVGVSFTGEQRDIYHRILSDFQTEQRWGKTFSAGFLRDKVNQIIANTIVSGDNHTVAVITHLLGAEAAEA